MQPKVGPFSFTCSPMYMIQHLKPRWKEKWVASQSPVRESLRTKTNKKQQRQSWSIKLSSRQGGDRRKAIGEMEKAKQFLELTEEESEIVSRLAIPAREPGYSPCFYEDFALKGIRVDRVEPGLVVCSFKVPPRLTDRNGKLATGAIANLIDEVGGALVHVEGLPMNDELEITARLLGRKGGYSGTMVLMRNKVTGEIIAEGRHSLFGKHASKL
ncbi:hypothetical protein TIFTF001_000301 [Ficus carica]|uniref:Uncharacterized protein n=1 Tax=Ficus carica TaxID=3494 RepID=A0AA87Z2C9_FICCA|nr:hypothetical protein TIFTF001_000301 [Ficus carica]